MSAYDPRWDAALDELEAEIAQLEFGLAAGNLEQIEAAGVWTPDPDLKVLPIELAERAADLARRMELAEEQATEVKDQLSTELGSLNRRRQASTAYLSNDAPQPQ